MNVKRIAVAALLAALLLAACSRGPAAVDEEAAGPLPEGSPVVPCGSGGSAGDASDTAGEAAR